MKSSNLSKLAGSSLIALSLAFAVSALPVSAQNNSDPNRTTLDTTPLQESENDNNHWGALGLLGLIGLANLFRKDDEPVHHR
jgi:hypothetical protein